MSKFSSPFMAKSPLNKNGDPDTYKVGEWLDQDKMAKNPDQFPAFYDSYSEVQEDDKGQFMTTLDQDKSYGGPRPTSSTVTNYDQGKDQPRDTLRPYAGKYFKKPRKS